jgi:hypothetical protein
MQLGMVTGSQTHHPHIHHAQLSSYKDEGAGHVERMVQTRRTYKIVVGKPVEKRPLGRPGVN